MDHKEIYRRYLAALLKPDTLGEFLAVDFIAHDMTPAGGPNELIAFRRAVMAAFPDQTYRILDILSEGDRVAVRLENVQTYLGEFRGIPPSGKRFSFEVYEIGQVSHGKIVARWTALKPSIAELIAQLTRT